VADVLTLIPGAIIMKRAVARIDRQEQEYLANTETRSAAAAPQGG